MTSYSHIPAVQAWVDQGIVQKRLDDERKELANAIDSARTILNPKTYNVFNGGTMFGFMAANATAYNSFRENKVI